MYTYNAYAHNFNHWICRHKHTKTFINNSGVCANEQQSNAHMNSCNKAAFSFEMVFIFEDPSKIRYLLNSGKFTETHRSTFIFHFCANNRYIMLHKPKAHSKSAHDTDGMGKTKILSFPRIELPYLVNFLSHFTFIQP